MLKYTTVVATLALSGIACAQEAVQWTEAEGGNDHWYAKVATPDGPSWSACQALAESLGGELISAPTIEERSWCRSTFGETYAIGLYQDTDADDYSEPAGGWRWLDGSAIDSDIWCIAEPDDGGGQDCAAGFFGSPFACVATGFCDQAFPAMLVEFSADCNDDGIVDYGQILDGSLADDDGNGIPDICSCVGDITNDGVVDVDDILMILGTWGSNYQPADIDGSGIVDVGDLLIALDGWGNCA